MSKLLLLNGPNLGRLGERKPEIYGVTSLGQIICALQEKTAAEGWALVSIQSNNEGALIDALEKHRDARAAVVNPGALMIAGWSLRDALEDFPAPWIEVHISNIWQREAFRKESILAPLARGVIAGLGADGYLLAAQALMASLEARNVTSLNAPLQRAEVEEFVRRAWAEALEAAPESINDDTHFFRAGGDSVKAFMVNLALEKSLYDWLPSEGLPVAAIASAPEFKRYVSAIQEFLTAGERAEEGVL